MACANSPKQQSATAFFSPAQLQDSYPSHPTYPSFYQFPVQPCKGPESTILYLRNDNQTDSRLKAVSTFLEKFDISNHFVRERLAESETIIFEQKSERVNITGLAQGKYSRLVCCSSTTDGKNNGTFTVKMAHTASSETL